MDGLVPLPTCLASGNELLESGLAATLRTKGVPDAQAKGLASAAMMALGAAKVQQAMQGKAPWRELKPIANQAVPVFQFVLPSELEVAVKARAADGRSIVSKRKQRQAAQFAIQTSRKQHSFLPALDSATIPAGVFTSSVGDLEHIAAYAVAPHAKETFCLMDSEAVLPYTQLLKPLSSSALGLLVPGQVPVEGAVLPGTALRNTAKLAATGEPILLAAHLYQLGAIEAIKFQPQQTAMIDVTPSAVLKICAYRDEIQQEWPDLVKAPIRALLDAMPQLRTCKKAECNCGQWHGVTAPGEPQALLDI